MIFHRLGLINKNQRGFTFIEILIAIAITGLITGGITTATFQVFNESTRSSNHMTAVRQVQNAGYWVSRDAQMAQSLEMAGVSGFPFTLTWTDWEGDEYQVVYTLDNNKLQRSYSINGITETGMVAQYIDPTETNCEVVAGIAGGTFNLPDGSSDNDEFTITDAVGGDSGTISVSMPGDVLRATPVDGATIAGGTDPVIINIASKAVAWATPDPGSMIIFTNKSNSKGTAGSWTATTGTATITITEDGDNDATLAVYGVFTLTVKATVGTGSQEGSETRVYRVVPKPSL